MGTDTVRQIFADYFQVYLADPDPLVDDDWSDAWKARSATADRLIARERILCFATERNTTVPLRVVSHDGAPDLTYQVLRADLAVKAVSIEQYSAVPRVASIMERRLHLLILGCPIAGPRRSKARTTELSGQRRLDVISSSHLR